MFLPAVACRNFWRSRNGSAPRPNGTKSTSSRFHRLPAIEWMLASRVPGRCHPPPAPGPMRAERAGNRSGSATRSPRKPSRPDASGSSGFIRCFSGWRRAREGPGTTPLCRLERCPAGAWPDPDRSVRGRAAPAAFAGLPPFPGRQSLSGHVAIRWATPIHDGSRGSGAHGPRHKQARRQYRRYRQDFDSAPRERTMLVRGLAP